MSDTVPNILGDMESNDLYCSDVKMMQNSGGASSTLAAKPSSIQAPTAAKNPSAKNVKKNTTGKTRAKNPKQLMSLSNGNEEVHKGALRSRVKTTTSPWKASVVRLSNPKKRNSANPSFTLANPPLNPQASSGG